MLIGYTLIFLKNIFRDFFPTENSEELIKFIIVEGECGRDINWFQAQDGRIKFENSSQLSIINDNRFAINFGSKKTDSILPIPQPHVTINSVTSSVKTLLVG